MAERRIIKGWIVERQADGSLVPIAPAGGQGGQMPADPGFQYEGPKAAADVRGSELDNRYKQTQIDEATNGRLPIGFRRSADGGAELIPGVPAPKDPNKPLLSATERANAIAGYQSALSLDKIISQMEAQYKTGPGSTSGLAGIQDYFPSTVNNQFDSTGNAARGTVGQALGFTGGQLNSVQEAQMAVGPYLPQSSDYDDVILDKIARLKQVRDDARARSIAMLGGVPDANGIVTPVQANEQAASDPSAGARALPRAAGAQQSAPLRADGATGRGGIENIPQLAGMENQVIDMIGRGAPRSEIVGFMNQQLAPYDTRVGSDLEGWIGERIADHQANPSAPVRSLGSGWEMLRHRKIPESESTALGRAADTDAGNFLMNGINSLFMGVPAMAAGGQDVLAAANDERPGASLAGKVAGSVGGMMGINAGAKALGGVVGNALTRGGGIGGDMLYGGVQGGVENGPSGAITGAALGGIGNKVGSGIINSTGRAVRGISDPAVNYLASRGIPMTAGQLLGNRGIVGRAMSKMESLPIIGDSLAARRMDSFERLFRAAQEDAGRGIGFSPTETGFAGVQAGLREAGNSLDNAVAGVDVPMDATAIQQMRSALDAGRALPDDLAARFGKAIDNRVAPALDTGRLTGPDYQQTVRGIRGYQAEAPKPGFEGDYRAALGEVEDALTGAINRGAGPQVAENLGNARTAYRDFKILEDASQKAQGGSQSGIQEIPTPAGIQAAVRRSKYARSGTQEPFGELTRYGQEVLPSTVPNSGSADRGFAGLLLPATLGGGAYAANQYADPKLAVPLALLAALSSKTGAKVAQKALTGRGPTARAIGTKLINQRRKAGLFGASAGVTMLPQFSQ